jgi:hypothetical protein
MIIVKEPVRYVCATTQLYETLPALLMHETDIVLMLVEPGRVSVVVICRKANLQESIHRKLH